MIQRKARSEPWGEAEFFQELEKLMIEIPEDSLWDVCLLPSITHAIPAVCSLTGALWLLLIVSASRQMCTFACALPHLGARRSRIVACAE